MTGKGDRRDYLPAFRGEKTTTADDFFYASQTVRRRVPCPCGSKSRSSDDAPKLNVPDALDLGTILIGSTVTRQLLIENAGGSVLKGTVTVDETVGKLDGKAAYNLRAGETQGLLAQAYARGGERLCPPWSTTSSHSSQVTELRAVVQATIGVTPAHLEIGRCPADGAIRAGELRIVNRSNEEQPLRLHAGSGLVVARSRNRGAPRARSPWPISTTPGQIGQVSDVVQVDSPSFATPHPRHRIGRRSNRPRQSQPHSRLERSKPGNP